MEMDDEYFAICDKLSGATRDVHLDSDLRENPGAVPKYP